MKKLLLLLIVIISISFTAFSQKTATLQIDYAFAGIQKENDHQSEIKVYVDGTLTATSEPKAESIPGVFSCAVPKGEHTIRVVVFSQFNGKWEEHTVANNYSIDCIYEISQKFSKKGYKLSLVFDIDKGTTGKFK